MIDSYYCKTGSYTLLEYGLFVTFYPQLIAGPIVLHTELIPQIRDIERKKVNYANISKGIMWFTLGLIKKVIVADTLGKTVAWTFNNMGAATSMDLILSMLSYTFQIYFDFSGYCDMASGIASMFNFYLPQNFDSPYKADSITDFWKRWHMTLTRFLREYIYFPLGGSRKGGLRTSFNILLVFLASGLWHGANWTFILWGILHGCANVANRIFQTSYHKLHIVTRWAITFLFINITWVIFRSETIEQAIVYFKKMLSLNSLTISKELYNMFILPESKYIYLVTGLHYFDARIRGFSMWLILGICMWICLNTANNFQRKYKTSILSLAVYTSLLM